MAFNSVAKWISLGTLFTGSISLLFIYQTQFGDIIHGVDEDKIRAKYDFVVIGAGSAGATVAARLSENFNYSVLLLEAGADRSFLSTIPLMSLFLSMTGEDWSFHTEPLTRAAGALKARRVKWSQGKCLGGSSNINAMLYTRGHPRDFDEWAEAGNPGWSFKDVFPYFLKSEGNRNRELTATPYHNSKGPLAVEDLLYKTPLVDAYFRAGQELGYEPLDVNGKSRTGFSIQQGTTGGGTRYSTARAFLVPAKDRPNLDISLRSFVEKIVIDPETKQATGVIFVRNKKRRLVEVRREVILSAGTLQSPKILMLSGVGPAEELNKFGIPVIQDLAVGRNLQDHVSAGGITFLVNQPVTYLLNRIIGEPKNLYDYFVNRQGPLTSLRTVEVLGFLNTKYANASEDHPDVELLIGSASISSDNGYQSYRTYNLRTDFYSAVFQPYEMQDGFTIFVFPLRPKSTGTVTLKSTKPSDPPIFNANYFDHPYDMKVIVEGIKLALNLGKAAALKEFGATFLPTIFPACRDFTFGSDEFCECYARQFTCTFWHFVGTCKMGPADDPNAVVDARLRVYGIKGLRVVDASVIPKMISGHTNAAVIMVGERAADLIKEDNP